MALHMREQALSAFLTRVTSLSTTGANVVRGRVYNIAEADLPHLSVFQGDEEPVIADNEDESVLIRAYYDVEILVQISVNAVSGVLETTMNLICKEISNAINADSTLGVTGVIDCFEVGTSQPELTGEKEKRTGQMGMVWKARYRRTRAAADVA